MRIGIEKQNKKMIMHFISNKRKNKGGKMFV
jgi:hypothetical protein